MYYYYSRFTFSPLLLLLPFHILTPPPLLSRSPYTTLASHSHPTAASVAESEDAASRRRTLAEHIASLQHASDILNEIREAGPSGGVLGGGGGGNFNLVGGSSVLLNAGYFGSRDALLRGGSSSSSSSSSYESFEYSPGRSRVSFGNGNSAVSAASALGGLMSAAPKAVSVHAHPSSQLQVGTAFSSAPPHPRLVEADREPPVVMHHRAAAAAAAFGRGGGPFALPSSNFNLSSAGSVPVVQPPSSSSGSDASGGVAGGPPGPVFILNNANNRGQDPIPSKLPSIEGIGGGGAPVLSTY